MRARLFFLFSPDVDPIEDYRPDRPEHVGVFVQAMIGPETDQAQDQGYESFDFLVCTPRWLAEDLGEKPYLFGRGHLIVPRYDYALVVAAIQRICRESIGPDWGAVASKLNRYGRWEFDEYTP